MGTDNLSPAAVSDGNQHISLGDDKGDILSRLQQAAGLQDKIDTGKMTDGLIDTAKHIWAGISGGVDIGKILSGEPAPPTDKERGDAEKTLEGRMSKLIPEADRDSMKAMTTALTNGDTKAFAEAVKQCGGDPVKLKALVTEVDKMLEEKGSSTRLDVTGDGKVLVSEAGHSTALAFDPKSGNVEAKSVEQNLDGSVLVKPGELLHVDTDKAFKEMGDSAVNAVNGKIDVGIIKHDPFLHPHPFWPGDEPLFPNPGKPITLEPGRPWTLDPSDPDWHHSVLMDSAPAEKRQF